MNRACIIEQDILIVEQIKSLIQEIDRQVDILVFRDLEDFYQWFKESMNSNQLPSAQLKLLIGDIQFLGPNYFSLIEKVRKLMNRRGFIKNEEDLAILLTAFESPNLNFKQIESRIITNIIFKPFDMPILKQQLQIALANNSRVTEFTLYQQKLSTSAEMLKEVQLEAFTELGFTTRSNRTLKVNDVSKYYSLHFDFNGRPSVFARCISCSPHPQFPGEYSTEFRYIGISNGQVKKLRQALFSIEHNPQLSSSVSRQRIPKALKKDLSPNSEVHFLVFLKLAGDPSIELKAALEQNLSNIQVSYNRNMAQFTEALTKADYSVLSNKPVHAIVLYADTFSPTHGVTTWSRIQDEIEKFNKSLGVTNPRPLILLTTTRDLNEESIRNWSGVVTDIIQTPIDRPYLIKRLTTLFPESQPRQEDLEIMSTVTNEIIRVANPIAINSISEACMTMKYYRPISFHSFRRFALPSPNSGEVLELLASCYYNEKKENYYINHFVFFGITDKYLKYIRKWILERHIAEKQSAA